MHTRMRKPILYFLIGASVAALCLWHLHGGYGFNLADEGFFWYGAKQTARGEVPGLDFMAYEPGRYYWAAAIFKILGDDTNKTARIASVLFGTIAYGLIASWLIGRREDLGTAKALFCTAFMTSTLGIWSFPYYRITDVAAPCLSFLLCYQQYEDRRLRTSLITGVWISTIMFFGRNHALYTLVSIAITITYLLLQEKDISRSAKRILLGSVGMMVGLAPFMVLGLLRAEYPRVIINQWLSALMTGRTNLPLPWPLPWTSIRGGMPLSEADGHFIIGILFMSLFAVAIAGTALNAITIIRGHWVQPELAAMTAATMGYLHYAVSRSDMEHIGPALMPLVLGGILWAARGKMRRVAACIVAIVIPTTRVALRQQSAYHCIRKTIECAEIEIDRNTKIVTGIENTQVTKALLEEVRGKRFVAVPAFPSLYAISDWNSPIWDIYAAWPRSDEEQLKAIKNIESGRIERIILSEDQFGKAARFRVTNPLLYDYLIREYTACRVLKDSILVCKKEPE